MLALALVHGWLHPPLSESGRKIACVGFNFIFHFKDEKKEARELEYYSY